MSKNQQPFHMQNPSRGSEDEEPLYIPETEDTQENDQSSDKDSNITRVDIGSIETHPVIAYNTYKAIGKGLISSARISDDGRIIISLDLKKKLPDLPDGYANEVKEYAVDEKTYTQPPNLAIVIMIVGSRGDVQPFLALGNELQKHGHRVRIATHATFRQFVKDAGLEFFSIGGDPQDLMSYMVRNPGLMPGFESLTNGDIPRKRKMLAEILDGCWRSCYEPDDESGNTFAADAIISNPPAFAHIHCAEALGIPLHLSFTMPWCPTTSFPHPLVNVSESNAEKGLTNYLSYAIADLMQWQGLGDVINRFRSKTLGLEPLSLRSGPSVTDRLKIPWTYCFSPALIPKPKDWMNHIDISGFYFYKTSENYRPPQDLEEFLAKGDKPIYIGFGSVVVDDAKAMTQTIFDAVERSGVRAIVSAGWGGLGGTDIPSSVFILPGHPGVPHDWLFKHVSAVCHHGGAGTTAIGLYLGCPTIIVPFFGDQPFWGAMVHKAGAGPKPIPQKQLTVETLTEGIQYCMTSRAQAAAEKMGEQIRAEDGVRNGVDSFHAHLPLLNMRCDLDHNRVAVWWSPKWCLKLSSYVVQVLVDAKMLQLDELEQHRSKEYDTRKKTGDPITGGVGAIFWTVTNYYGGIAQIFYNPVKGIINTTTAIPRGILNIVGSVQEGLQNAPKLYGSKVREPGPVTDFKSGVSEAGKAFFYGYYDGITGLVREPYEGAKKGGFLGAVKGSARSFVNVNMRPAAGALGLVAHPTRGAWKSMQQMWATQQESQQRSTRISNGQMEVKKTSPANKEEIKQAFMKAKETINDRREALKAEVQSFWESGGGLGFEKTGKGKERQTPPASAHSSTEPSRKGTLNSSRDDRAPKVPPRPEQRPTQGGGEDDQFEKDLALAMQISLAEQRGYERGLARSKDAS